MNESCMYQWEGIRAVHCSLSASAYPYSAPKALGFSAPILIELRNIFWNNILVCNPISCGIKEPHCLTSHAACKLAIHSPTISSTISLVNSGRRRMWLRIRLTSTFGMEGAIAVYVCFSCGVSPIETSLCTCPYRFPGALTGNPTCQIATTIK